MRITPLDIIQKQFTGSRRGYDSEEVRQFLEEVRESMEEQIKENQRLRELVAQREAEIEDIRGKESDIKETLMLAKRLSDDLEKGARREADVIVGEARLEAERLMMAVAEERRSIHADIVHLRADRFRVMADLRSIVDAMSKMLDDFERESTHQEAESS